MVLIMKVCIYETSSYAVVANLTQLTAFCWNVQDGRLPESELSDFQKEHMLKEIPGLLDYAGYVVR